MDSIIKTMEYICSYRRAGALLAEAIKEAEVIAFHDLGPEAIYRLG